MKYRINHKGIWLPLAEGFYEVEPFPNRFVKVYVETIFNGMFYILRADGKSLEVDWEFLERIRPRWLS